MNVARLAWIAGIVIAVVAAMYITLSNSIPLGAQCATDNDCSAAGCSGQICTTSRAAPGVVTTCEWREEYGCLQLTNCGCVDGTCAWRNTAEYQNCLTQISG